MKSDTKKTKTPKSSMESVDKLLANPKNARTHSAKQIKKIAKSIDQFGFINPIVIDSDKVIFAGHGRLEAAKDLEIKEVPCVDVSYLSEEQKRAYMLADNRIATESRWDESILKNELEELMDNNIDLNITGFDEYQIDAIFKTPTNLEGDPELQKGEDTPFQKKSFVLHNSQADEVKQALKLAKTMGDFINTNNENHNGNALHRICQFYIDQNSKG